MRNIASDKIVIMKNMTKNKIFLFLEENFLFAFI